MIMISSLSNEALCPRLRCKDRSSSSHYYRYRLFLFSLLSFAPLGSFRPRPHSPPTHWISIMWTPIMRLNIVGYRRFGFNMLNCAEYWIANLLFVVGFAVASILFSVPSSSSRCTSVKAKLNQHKLLHRCCGGSNHAKIGGLLCCYNHHNIIMT